MIMPGWLLESAWAKEASVHTSRSSEQGVRSRTSPQRACTFRIEVSLPMSGKDSPGSALHIVPQSLDVLPHTDSACDHIGHVKPRAASHPCKLTNHLLGVLNLFGGWCLLCGFLLELRKLSCGPNVSIPLHQVTNVFLLVDEKVRTLLLNLDSTKRKASWVRCKGWIRALPYASDSVKHVLQLLLPSKDKQVVHVDSYGTFSLVSCFVANPSH